MIGISAERFTIDLYAQIKKVASTIGKEVAKASIFGRDATLSEKRKLELLKFFGVITPANHDKLSKIRKLRNQYMHRSLDGDDVGSDARKAMKLFQQVINERFDSKYTITEGRIASRVNPNI